jgi:hypothetical protein
VIVLVPHAHGHLDARTVASLEKFAPPESDIRYREIAEGDRQGYSRILVEAWGWPGDLMIVEQDIEIHRGVIEVLSDCSQPWCGFPYPIADSEMVCLGCTRFSAHLKATRPTLMSEAAAVGSDEDGGGVPAGVWERMDVRIGFKLEMLGHNRHTHHPRVEHHHFYPQPGG